MLPKVMRAIAPLSPVTELLSIVPALVLIFPIDSNKTAFIIRFDSQKSTR